MSRRSRSFSGWSSQLSAGIAAASTSFAVDSATGLDEPVYLVIDPESLTKREHIKVGLVTGNTLSTVTRGLSGSVAGAQDHDPGTEVRAVMVHQHLDDIFLDIEALETADTTHTTDIDGLETDVTALQAADTALQAADAAHFGGTDVADHPEATGAVRGFMSAADKTALDGLAAGLGSFIEFGGASENVLDGTIPVDPTFDAGATVTFTKPAAWNTYKIMAWGTVHGNLRNVIGQNIAVKVSIGGNDGTVMQGGGNGSTPDSSTSASARHERTGLTTNADIVVHYAEHQAAEDFVKYGSIINFIAIRTS